jgi:hypothetical protein
MESPKRHVVSEEDLEKDSCEGKDCAVVYGKPETRRGGMRRINGVCYGKPEETRVGKRTRSRDSCVVSGLTLTNRSKY